MFLYMYTIHFDHISPVFLPSLLFSLHIANASLFILMLRSTYVRAHTTLVFQSVYLTHHVISTSIHFPVNKTNSLYLEAK